CCDDDVADDILKEDPGIVKGSVKDLLASIKRIAVLPVAKSVKRAELFSLKQQVDEPVRSFYARVKGKAETCGFSSKCGCKRMIVKDITIAGLADIDIRRDAMSLPNADDKPLEDVLTIIEARETIHNALLGEDIHVRAAKSTFKREGDKTGLSGECPKCGGQFKLYTASRKGLIRHRMLFA
ncbi:Hypothetical protein FKW44_009757, partial [Caligus rogercresseyi]